jgi:Fe2+ transport system protein FeoA
MSATDRVDFNENDNRSCRVCPLNRIKAGAAVRIKQLCAAPEISHRLREIGFCEDQIIKLITSQANIICLVCNARLAISSQLAGLIMVEPIRQLVLATVH